MTQLLDQPVAEDFPPITEGLDDEAILRRLERDDRNLEYDDGIFLEKDVSVESSFVAMWIGHLFLLAATTRGGARVYPPDLIYRCWSDDPRRFRKPDVTVVSADRAASIGVNPRVMTIPPDLAVEVVSPTNTADDVEEKLELYRQAGFGPVWVVFLRTRVIDVHHPDGTVTRLRGDDEITAGPVLPTFRRKVSELFGPTP